jgi:hypothetical protein
MTVSELTVEDADAILRKMYYNVESYGEEVDAEDAEDYDEHWAELAWSLKSEYIWTPTGREEKVPGQTVGDIHVTCVENFGGEGKGDSRWVVFSFADATGTKYFRKDGYYASYDGSTWDGEFREVTPRQRQVTFYE